MYIMWAHFKVVMSDEGDVYSEEPFEDPPPLNEIFVSNAYTYRMASVTTVSY